MHTPPQHEGTYQELLAQIAFTDAKADGAAGHGVPCILSLCDVDVPAQILDGRIYVVCESARFFETIAEVVSHVIGDLEAGVPAAWRAALSSTDIRSPLHFGQLASERLVRNGGIGG